MPRLPLSTTKHVQRLCSWVTSRQPPVGGRLGRHGLWMPRSESCSDSTYSSRSFALSESICTHRSTWTEIVLYPQIPTWKPESPERLYVKREPVGRQCSVSGVLWVDAHRTGPAPRQEEQETAVPPRPSRDFLRSGQRPARRRALTQKTTADLHLGPSSTQTCVEVSWFFRPGGLCCFVTAAGARSYARTGTISNLCAVSSQGKVMRCYRIYQTHTHV